LSGQATIKEIDPGKKVRIHGETAGNYGQVRVVKKSWGTNTLIPKKKKKLEAQQRGCDGVKKKKKEKSHQSI